MTIVEAIQEEEVWLILLHNDILCKITLHSCSAHFFQYQYVLPVVGKTKLLLPYYRCWLLKMLRQQQFCSSVAERQHARFWGSVTQSVTVLQSYGKHMPKYCRTDEHHTCFMALWFHFFLVCLCPYRFNVPLKFADYVQILVTCISSAGPWNRMVEFGVVAIRIPGQFCLSNCAEKHQVLLWSRQDAHFHSESSSGDGKW